MSARLRTRCLLGVSMIALSACGQTSEPQAALELPPAGTAPPPPTPTTMSTAQPIVPPESTYTTTTTTAPQIELGVEAAAGPRPADADLLAAGHAYEHRVIVAASDPPAADWWVTAWVHTTDTGAEVLCNGSLSGRHCGSSVLFDTDDLVGVRLHQVGGIPSQVILAVAPDVRSVDLIEGNGRTPLELVDVGAASGVRLAAARIDHPAELTQIAVVTRDGEESIATFTVDEIDPGSAQARDAGALTPAAVPPAPYGPLDLTQPER